MVTSAGSRRHFAESTRDSTAWRQRHTHKQIERIHPHNNTTHNLHLTSHHLQTTQPPQTTHHSTTTQYAAISARILTTLSISALNVARALVLSTTITQRTSVTDVSLTTSMTPSTTLQKTDDLLTLVTHGLALKCPTATSLTTLSFLWSSVYLHHSLIQRIVLAVEFLPCSCTYNLVHNATNTLVPHVTTL